MGATFSINYTTAYEAGEPILAACPVCLGTGLVSTPPHVAGDVTGWTSSTVGTYPCKACSGRGLIYTSEL